MNFKESSSVELKSIVNDDFKKEVIAFANTNGGEIYVGVDDDGVVVGVDNADKVIVHQLIDILLHQINF